MSVKVHFVLLSLAALWISADSARGQLPWPTFTSAANQAGREPASGSSATGGATQAGQDVSQADAERAAAAERARQVGDLAARLNSLEDRIELARNARDAARGSARRAEQTVQTLQHDLDERLQAGAGEQELADLRQQIEAAQQRWLQLERQQRLEAEALERLQLERSTLLAEQVVALRAAEDQRAEADDARPQLERARNPFAPENVKAWLYAHGLTLLIIAVGTALLHWLLSRFADRIVSFIVRNGVRGTREEREQRAQTLVGVFHHSAAVALYVAAILMVLDALSIPITALLGGVAVVGLAVAFGAQNLIRDYFHGFIILLENQYGVNDVVRIADTAGLVERITLRMTVLRDLEGVVHFIPHGEVTKVSNMTHGWSRALLEIGVAYKEDPDRVMEVLMDVARAMRQDEKFGELILEDPEMLGVDAFGDSAIVIKFFVKTRPLKQWMVRRELLRRIKRRFTELGIEIPFPHRTIYHRHSQDGAKPIPDASEAWSE